MKPSRSQYGEHALILRHFAERTGRFLDIGAFDGITFSNTRQLADLGWSGVCVEPSPPAFCALMQNYHGNDRVELVNAGMVSSDSHVRLVKFYANTLDAISADMMSTFDEGHKAKWVDHPFRPMWTSTLRWNNLIAAFGREFDFVNIDVEGINLEVLREMPIRPEMLCYEWDQTADGNKPLELLRGIGYGNHQVIGGNLLAWR